MTENTSEVKKIMIAILHGGELYWSTELERTEYQIERTIENIADVINNELAFWSMPINTGRMLFTSEILKKSIVRIVYIP
jgi:hypothetical protein